MLRPMRASVGLRRWDGSTQLVTSATSLRGFGCPGRLKPESTSASATPLAVALGTGSMAGTRQMESSWMYAASPSGSLWAMAK